MQGEILDDCVPRDGTWSCLTLMGQWAECALTEPPSSADGRLLVAQVCGPQAALRWRCCSGAAGRACRSIRLCTAGMHAIAASSTRPPPPPLCQRTTAGGDPCLLPAVFRGRLFFDCVHNADSSGTVEICPTPVRGVRVGWGGAGSAAREGWCVQQRE